MENTVEIIIRDFHKIESLESLDEKVRYVMEANPYNNDNQVTGSVEGWVNGELGGHEYVFPMRFCCENKSFPLMSGSTLSVKKEFRKYELGLMLPEKFLEISSRNCTFTGASKAAERIYKFYGIQFFYMKRFVYIVNSDFLVNMKLKGLIGKMVSSLINLFLHSAYNILKLSIEQKFRAFKIVEKTVENIDYEGVERIMDADGHKYREDHGKEWIKWVMNYKEKNTATQQHFYEVYLHDKIVGFFINKVNFRKLLNSKYKNVRYGTILEWGSIDQNVLKDSDLCAMAFSKFGKMADAIAMCSNKDEFSTSIPNMLKRRMGDLNFAVCLDKKQFPDYKNENNWRIRPAGGDMSF